MRSPSFTAVCGVITDPGTILLTAHEQSTVEPVRPYDSIPSPRHGYSTFFLLPSESDDTREYRGLAQCLSCTYAVFILRESDCGLDDSTTDSIERSTQNAVETILRTEPSVSCMVGGIRESGIVAFEVARRLERLGRSVHLVLFDTPLPGGRVASPSNTLQSITRQLARYFRSKAQPPHPGRAASFAILHFVPEEGEDPLLTPSRLGWERQTSAATDIVYLSGTHQSLLAEANLPHIGGALRRWNAAGQ